MELMATLRAYMSTKGLKWTDQRRLIAEVFFRAKRHLSIEELLALARAVDSHVGYATVYRTLKLLADCGVATERMFQDGLKRYEVSLGDEHHDHLICVACGAIEEFSDPRIEELQRDVATRATGFQLTSHKHEMYGVCPTCVAAGNAAG